MYEIVVGVDENEDRAQAIGRELLNLPGEPEELHATLVHAFEDNPSGASVAQVGAVKHLKATLEEAGVTVELEEAGAEPAETIMTFAREEDADLIAVAGRKRTPTGKVLFGSVTQAIILGTNKPVLVCSSR
jgi:nucleotide-binding universal stress UspA family protein